MSDVLRYETSAFSKCCPDCGAAISYVQFGSNMPSESQYPGFQFVEYECRANYYFNGAAESTTILRRLCPSTLKTCALCGEKLSSLVDCGEFRERLKPFCSERCAVKWALANVVSKVEEPR